MAGCAVLVAGVGIEEGGARVALVERGCGEAGGCHDARGDKWVRGSGKGGRMRWPLLWSKAVVVEVRGDGGQDVCEVCEGFMIVDSRCCLKY